MNYKVGVTGPVKGPYQMCWRVRGWSKSNKEDIEEDVFSCLIGDSPDVIAKNFCKYCAKLRWDADIDIHKDYSNFDEFNQIFEYELIRITPKEYLGELLGGLY